MRELKADLCIIGAGSAGLSVAAGAAQLGLNVVLFDMQFREFMLGWLAFATLFALALTSNDASVHRLGRWWKPLQRLAYVSALAAVLRKAVANALPELIAA